MVYIPPKPKSRMAVEFFTTQISARSRNKIAKILDKRHGNVTWLNKKLVYDFTEFRDLMDAGGKDNLRAAIGFQMDMDEKSGLDWSEIRDRRGAWQKRRRDMETKQAGIKQQRISSASIHRVRHRIREGEQERLEALTNKTVSTLKALMDKANQTLAKQIRKVDMPPPTKNIYKWSERELVRKDYYKFTTHSERIADESRTDTIAKTRAEWITDIKHLDFAGIDDAPPKDIKVVIVTKYTDEDWQNMNSDDLGYDDITESPAYQQAAADHSTYVENNLTDLNVVYDEGEWQDRFADDEDVEEIARDWMLALPQPKINDLVDDLDLSYDEGDDKLDILESAIDQVTEHFTNTNPKGLYKNAFDEWREANKSDIAYDLISEGLAEFIFDDWSNLSDTGCGNMRGSQRVALLKEQHNGKYREIGYTTFTDRGRQFGIGSSCIAPSERGKQYFGYLRRGLINYADKLGKSVTTSASASGGENDPDTDKLERIYSSYGRTSAKGTGVNRLRHDEAFEKKEGLIDADYEGLYLWANRKLKQKLKQRGFGDEDEGEKCILSELNKENRPITRDILEEMANNCNEYNFVIDFREQMKIMDYEGTTSLNEEEF